MPIQNVKVAFTLSNQRLNAWKTPAVNFCHIRRAVGANQGFRYQKWTPSFGKYLGERNSCIDLKKTLTIIEHFEGKNVKYVRTFRSDLSKQSS